MPFSAHVAFAKRQFPIRARRAVRCEASARTIAGTMFCKWCHSHVARRHSLRHANAGAHYDATIVKETRTQQMPRAVDKAMYMVPSTYLVKRGSAVMHLHDIQFVDCYYRQFATEIRLDVHTSHGGKSSFLPRGIDVVKLTVWLREHTKPRKPTM